MRCCLRATMLWAVVPAVQAASENTSNLALGSAPPARGVWSPGAARIRTSSDAKTHGEMLPGSNDGAAECSSWCTSL